MKKILIPIAALIALMLIAVGCETSSSAAKLDEAPGGYTTVTHEGITLRFSYLDGKDLLALYNNRNNPFIEYKSGRLMVIETAIQSDTSLQLGLENAQLSTPGGDRGPVSKETLHDYWYNLLKKKYEGYGKGGGQYSNWTMKIVMETIDKTVLASDAQVLAGTETVGYILFDQVRGEKKVNATLTLPVYDSQGELLHEFEFSFPI